MAALSTTGEELFIKAKITIDGGIIDLSIKDLIERAKISVSEEQPTPDVSIEDILRWFNQLFEATLAVGALGAGFTFSVIVSDLPDPSPDFTVDQVRRYLALAWLLFVILIAAACVGSLLFSFQRDWFIDFAHSKRRRFVTATTSLVIQLLIMAPFMVSAWAVEAYVRDVGLAAYVLTLVYGGSAVFLWIMQTL
jgi:hypothetical protein